MPHNKRTIISAIVAFLWFFGIIVVYYSSHKPFTAEFAINVLWSAWRLIVGLTLVALAGGIGYRIFRDESLNPFALLALQMALGLGFLALTVLLIGVTVGLPFWLPALLLILLLVVFRKPAWAWTRQWRAWQDIWRQSDRFSRTLGSLIAGLLFAALLYGLAPPLKYDSLVYHLVLPDAYLRAGRIEYLPWIMKSGMPQTAEMLYALSMALSGAAGAAVMGWAVSVVTVMGLWGYLHQRLGARPAWVGIAALLAGFSMPIHTSWAYVDWWCLMFGFGALVCLDRWRQDGVTHHLVIAGLMAGFALGTKYPAGVLGIAAGTTLLWNIWRKREKLLPRLFTFGAVAVLAPLPWLVKNFVTTGNPLYPLFFVSGSMTAVRHEVYQVLPPYGNWQDFVLLPFFATYMGHDTAVGYSVAIGPLLLALGLLSWIGWRRLAGEQRLSLESATVFAITGLVVWAVGNQLSGLLIQTRFYFSIFPAFTLLAAYGYRTFSDLKIPGVRLGRIVSALVVLVMVLNTIDAGLFVMRSRTPQVLLGLEDSDAYIAHNLGWYQPVMKALLELPQEYMVLMLLEPRSFHCRPRCEPDEIFDRWRYEWSKHANTEDILTGWRAEGYTHLLFHQAGAQAVQESGQLYYTSDEWQALDQLIGGIKEVKNFNDVYILYDIR
ncbi:MAG TPA: glycosyltransferase family 39 protein [Levilinea sp.]|nr:glycosyltransferase family 39 protein [Levilinea sp.]